MGKKYQKTTLLPTLQKGVQRTNIEPKTRKNFGAIEPGATITQHDLSHSHVNLNSGKFMKDITVKIRD